MKNSKQLPKYEHRKDNLGQSCDNKENIVKLETKSEKY